MQSVRVCEYCGQEFEPTTPAQKYCSAKCGGQAFFSQSKERKEKYAKARKKNADTEKVILCEDTSCKFYDTSYLDCCKALVKPYAQGRCKFYKERKK